MFPGSAGDWLFWVRGGTNVVQPPSLASLSRTQRLRFKPASLLCRRVCCPPPLHRGLEKLPRLQTLPPSLHSRGIGPRAVLTNSHPHTLSCLVPTVMHSPTVTPPVLPLNLPPGGKIYGCDRLKCLMCSRCVEGGADQTRPLLKTTYRLLCSR